MLAETVAQVEESLPFLKWLGTASGTAVAGACVWLVYTGRLVLKRELDYREEVLRDTAEDRDEWKARALAVDQKNDRLLATSEKAVGTTEHAVEVAKQIAGSK